MASKTLGPEGVVWISPESLQRDERERIVKAHRGDADSLIEKLDAVAALPGEYRRIKDYDNGDDPSLGSATRVEGGQAVTEYEDEKLVCVGQGEYEVYDPEKHGEPYSPLAQELRVAPEEAKAVEK